MLTKEQARKLLERIKQRKLGEDNTPEYKSHEWLEQNRAK